MNEKKSFSQKIGDFLAGKGFYIVLAVCAAVIGVSAWILLGSGVADGGTDVNEPGSLQNLGTAEVYAPETDVPISADIDWESETVFNREDLNPPKVVPTPAPTPSVSPSVSPSASPSPAPKPEKPKAEEKLTFVRPVAGEIVMAYAVDELIYDRTMGDWRTHNGIDIAAELGTRVLAAADGTVAEVYADELLGTVVVIDHGSGICSQYANLAATPAVKVGDKVAMGAVIGSVGDTALGEAGLAAHLHFAMTQDGEPVNPETHLPPA